MARAVKMVVMMATTYKKRQRRRAEGDRQVLGHCFHCGDNAFIHQARVAPLWHWWCNECPAGDVRDLQREGTQKGRGKKKNRKRRGKIEGCHGRVEWLKRVWTRRCEWQAKEMEALKMGREKRARWDVIILFLLLLHQGRKEGRKGERKWRKEGEGECDTWWNWSWYLFSKDGTKEGLKVFSNIITDCANKGVWKREKIRMEKE